MILYSIVTGLGINKGVLYSIVTGLGINKGVGHLQYGVVMSRLWRTDDLIGYGFNMQFHHLHVTAVDILFTYMHACQYSAGQKEETLELNRMIYFYA